MLEHVENKGLSQRAACRWSGVSRAVSRYELCRPDQDAEYLKKMRTAAKDNPRYGYRRVAVISGVGFGSAWRLWKQYRFKIEVQRTRKPRKKDKSATPLPQQAEYPNHVWTYDILFDRLADDGRHVGIPGGRDLAGKHHEAGIDQRLCRYTRIGVLR